MGAHRKLDAIAIEQIVAARGGGRSFRQIGASLGVSHSTVSRLIASDPLLRTRIRAAEQREQRRARDRARKARAKVRREAGLEQPGAVPEDEQRFPAGPCSDEGQPSERTPELVAEASQAPPDHNAISQPSSLPEPRQGAGRLLRPFRLGESYDPTPRWWREQRKAVPGSKLHSDLVWMYRQGDNQNFEPDEVEAALAQGWRPHE